jgi:hypothetical protein
MFRKVIRKRQQLIFCKMQYLTIAGNGGVNTAANTITFNFSKAVKEGSGSEHSKCFF